jgi:hypothetical protein
MPRSRQRDKFMATPIPVFPAAVVTDTQLKVANNLIQTTLRVNIDGSNTILFVASTAGFTANCLISIDKEIIAIDSIVSGPNPALIVASGGRGFDGTSATTHAAGAKVSMFIDAWHHNVLSAEVKAIESFLGPNGQNIGGASVFLVSKTYDFAAQSPGGALIVGNNVITLSPVPKGVNGSDQSHYLYISGGTGTPEAVLITGGTAVSGAASGTVIVNCASAHSGAWTIASATAGIQEAVNQLPNGGMIVIPAGVSNVYAATTITGDYIEIRGVGAASFIQANHNTGSIFYFNQIGNGTGGPRGWFNALYRVRMRGPGSPGSLTAIQIRGQLGMRILDNDIFGIWRGIWVNDAAGAITSAVFIYRNTILNVPQNGFAIHIIGGADHFIVNNHTSGDSAATPAGCGILLEYTAGTKIIANGFYLFGVGVQMSPGDGGNVATVESIDNWYDSAQGDGLKIVPQGTGIVSEIRSIHDRLAAGTGNGISIFGTSTNILGVIISDALVAYNRGNGIQYTGGADVELNNCHCYGNSNGSPGISHGLVIEAGASNLRVRGGTYAQSSAVPGATPPNTQGYGIYIHAGASDYVMIESAVVTPNLSGGLINGGMTGTHNVIRNVVGYNPVGQAAITVGASPFTYTAGPSPEVVYIAGGTVTQIRIGSTVIANASPAFVPLAPNEAVIVTYSVAPTMAKDVQ